MTMAALAWTLKAWTALLLPVTPAGPHPQRPAPPSAGHGVPHLRLRFINLPAQIVRAGRQIRWRILAYNPWLGCLFRLADGL